MRLYVGSANAAWLRRAPFPLFISHATLRRRRSEFPPATAPGWALDSGGFTELTAFGEWRTTPGEYVDAVERYAEEIGRLEWAAPQDFMCEPWITARTGLTVDEHIGRTVESYLDLVDRAPHLPWAPVVQGWRLDDYLDSLDRYAAAGVNLAAAPVVGLGSVCRRQHTGEIAAIVGELHRAGLANLHGFGVKVRGLANIAPLLSSADSLAWSFDARHAPALPGCTHRRCVNCLRYAARWRARVLDTLTRPHQLALPF